MDIASSLNGMAKATLEFLITVLASVCFHLVVCALVELFTCVVQVGIECASVDRTRDRSEIAAELACDTPRLVGSLAPRPLGEEMGRIPIAADANVYKESISAIEDEKMRILESMERFDDKVQSPRDFASTSSFEVEKMFTAASPEVLDSGYSRANPTSDDSHTNADLISVTDPYSGLSGLLQRELDGSERLLGLPFKVLQRVSDRVQTLPREKWTAPMYSCKFWNDMLSEPLLRRVGLTSTPWNLEVELSGVDAFLMLLHWRRSRYFRAIDNLKLRFSNKEKERDVQLVSVSRFFASLEVGVQHFGTLHFSLNDYEHGVNLPLLSDAIHNVHRTGCLDFWIYSSYLAEPGLCDVVPRAVPDLEHNMEYILVQSPLVFSKAIRPWFVRTLEVGSSLTSVDVLCSGMEPLDWSTVLPHISLPRLQALRLVGVDLTTLADFLNRHPLVKSPLDWSTVLPHISLPRLQALRLVGVDLTTLADFLNRHPLVKYVRLDGLQSSSAIPTASLVLPKLSVIEGNEHQLSNFLGILEPRPTLLPVTVTFRDDCSFGVQPTAFDEKAFQVAFRHLGELHGTAPLSLRFCFSNLRHLSPSFFSCDVGRPERRLRVNKLDLNFFNFTSAQCKELLDQCVDWLTLFLRIKELRVCVGDIVLSDADKKRYAQAFMGSLEDTAVSFSWS